MTALAHLRALVGRTPLVELRSLSPHPGVRLFAKLEGQNPSGSIKDRVVCRILEQARRRGALRPGQRIVEASTGNTGVSLALFGRLAGHPVDVCVPESVYPEIGQLLRVYGANIRWVPRQAGIKTANEMAAAVCREEDAYLLNQFGDDENWRAHYEGTGGTVTGAGRRLKEANPACKVVGVEPRLGVHVQGLKSLDDGFIPPVLDESVLDGKIIVGNRHAFSHARRAMMQEGIFGGISSGAVLHAATRAAARLQSGNIVMIFADAGWKYLGTNIWREDENERDVDDSEDPVDDILWW